MGSGKYGAISAAVGRMELMDKITEHLASAKTPGYKKGVTTFSAKLSEATSGMATKGVNYTELTKEEIDFTHGELEYSGDPLDVALNGNGFFQIQRDDDSFGYTRKGNFRMNGDGELVDSNGYQVMGVDGVITLDSSNVTITSNGEIWDENGEVAKLAIFEFPDTSILSRAGEEMFEALDGTEPDLYDEPELVQSNLESSNIDMMSEMASMTSNLRAYEAAQKALTIYSEMDSQASGIGQIQ